MKVERTLPACYAQVVVDTNVLISAALSPDGAPARLLRRFHGESRLVFAPATFSELETRLWKPKFDRWLSIEERQQYLRIYSSIANWLDDAAVLEEWSRDRDDDMFIELARRAGVTRLITGDADLLCLDPLGGLRILTPRAALDELLIADHP
jgi:putative PIN family toxin of toxin-antitoxin system